MSGLCINKFIILTHYGLHLQLYPILEKRSTMKIALLLTVAATLVNGQPGNRGVSAQNKNLYQLSCLN